jgi:hypothetical protein
MAQGRDFRMKVLFSFPPMLAMMVSLLNEALSRDNFILKTLVFRLVASMDVAFLPKGITVPCVCCDVQSRIRIL